MASHELLTVAEAADFFRVQVTTIRAWVLKKKIPYVKLGGKRVLFRREDLDNVIQSSLVAAAQ